ncbi:cell division protein SepF [Actinoallomurus iriomotensis]|uniref:cell division protein SepF n=1 Tax=Actinoallomurus iriomotensis TaxID=478107 RepID=UPI0025563EDF|nr:cell division protein SepF [Actinoallomurus iriomotensis]
MRTDSEVLSFVEACGPTLALLFAVLVVAFILQRGWKPRDDRQHATFDYAARTPQGRSELTIALEDASALNAYDAHTRRDPDVRLASLVRFEPSEYQAAAYEVARHFREGNVISIDLGAMDNHQAARLVDFCSGITVMSSGWIFRVTDKVIVLNPPD